MPSAVLSRARPQVATRPPSRQLVAAGALLLLGAAIYLVFVTTTHTAAGYALGLGGIGLIADVISVWAHRQSPSASRVPAARSARVRSSLGALRPVIVAATTAIILAVSVSG